MTASELFILARPAASAGWKRLSHGLGIAAGLYFACVVAFFLLHVIPNIALRGWIDTLALIAYLLGVVPLGISRCRNSASSAGRRQSASGTTSCCSSAFSPSATSR